MPGVPVWEGYRVVAMDTVRVIFLDIDGVLNCLSRWGDIPDVSRVGTKLCPDATARLKRIVDATDAQIVVSSTWRIHFMRELEQWLHRHGINRSRVIGATPTSSQSPGGIYVGDTRGGEIRAWLNAHPGVVEAFVILDDDTVMGSLAPHHVVTTWAEGLLDEHVDPAIALLLGKNAHP